jgi:hypothetical protein
LSYDRAIGQLTNSVSRPTLYKVTMPGKFIGRGTNDYLEYFCNAAAIPSVRYNGVNVTGHSLMGITRIQPTSPVWTNPMEITVIENSDLTTYADFKQWFDQTGEGIDQEGLRNIKLKYYDDIVGDIELEKIEFSNQSLKTPLRVKFLNAYPKAIGPITLRSDQPNTYTTFNVQFNYEAYTTQFQ